MNPDDFNPTELAAGDFSGLARAIHSHSTDVLNQAASDPALPEDLALSLLKRADLPSEALERLSKNASVMKIRRVKLAVVKHPRTPRHSALRMVRTLFTFDLLQVTMMPSVPDDIKRAGDNSLAHRVETLSMGERLSLARRGSGRLAALLLVDGEPRVMRAALENSRLTESALLKTITRPSAPNHLVEAVCHHPTWSVRSEVRLALLRNEKTPLASALQFVNALPAAQVRDVLHGSHLPSNVRSYVMKELSNRKDIQNVATRRRASRT